MPNIIRRDLLKGTAAAAAQSTIFSAVPSWARARKRTGITHYPTVLGGGGHNTNGQSIPNQSIFGNVGLGRDILADPPATNQSLTTQYIRVPGTVSNLSWGFDYYSGSDHFSNLTLCLNVDTSPTSLAVSFGPSTTVSGWMTDSSDTVTVTAGQRLSFQADPDGSGTFKGALYCASAEFLSDDVSLQSAQMIDAVGPAQIQPTTTQKFGHFLGVWAGVEGLVAISILANASNNSCVLRQAGGEIWPAMSSKIFSGEMQLSPIV